MYVPWAGERCILCGQVAPMNQEAHVIPQSIGGTLYSYFECDSCNPHVGSHVEANVPKSVQLRLAADRLESEIPALCHAIRKGRLYVANREDRLVRFIRGRDGRLSLLSDENDVTLRTCLRILRSASAGVRGGDKQAESAAVESFRQAPLASLTPSTMTSSWCRAASTPRRRSDMPTTTLFDERAAALIAWRFLAIAHPSAAFLPHFEPVRDWLRDGGEPPGVIEIRPGTTDRYAPTHFLGIRPEERALTVRVIQARLVGVRRRFHGATTRTAPFGIVHDLRTGSTPWRARPGQTTSSASMMYRRSSSAASASAGRTTRRWRSRGHHLAP